MIVSESPVTEISDRAKLPADPLVSVYMLTYRHEKYIAKAIEGVVNQQCLFPFELIIGEDCSPDRTREIALDYQRRFPQRIRVLVSPSNVGSRANMERSVAAARGSYIAICEGDDYWQHLEKLQLQVDAMLATPAATLCHTDFDRRLGWRIRRSSHRSRPSSNPANGNAFEDVLQQWSIMTATAMYRGDIFRNFLSTPFNDQSWPFGDYNKALYAAANGPLIYLPVSTATWRKVPGSATNRGYASSLGIAQAYLECRERFMAAYPIDENLMRKVRSISHRNIARRAFLAGRSDVFENSVENLSRIGTPVSKYELAWRRRILRTPVLHLAMQTMHKSIQRIGMLGA